MTAIPMDRAVSGSTGAGVDTASDISWRRLQQLYRQWGYGIPGQLAAAALLATVLWPSTDHRKLLLWLGLVMLHLVVRAWGWWRFRRRASAVRRSFRAWFSLFIAVSVVSGFLWAGAGALVTEEHQLVQRGFTALWIGGLAAGCVASHAVFMRAYLAFALPAMVPYSIYLLSSSEPLERSAGIGCLLLLLFLLLVARQVNRSLRLTLELEFEKTELIRRLNAEQARVQSLNQRLRIDLSERKQTENALRSAKEQAESLADELRQLSARDGLTGIANRRHFQESLEREWSRALRAKHSLALVLGDIDNFKRFNDGYGHLVGDECLKSVASLFAHQARRAGDLAGRYGGEEFVLLLPDADAEYAALVAGGLRHAIEALGIVHEHSDTAPVVTASFGVASVTPARADASAQLVAMADTAMYRAKAAGRNRVVVDPASV